MMHRRTMVGGTMAIMVAGVSDLRPGAALAEAPLLLGVTTSTDNSGMLAHLLEAFHQHHDLEIRAVTAGTGAILNMASRGDVSAVLVHAPDDEAAFMRAGYGSERRAVMQNRFQIIGPSNDPAGVRKAPDAAAAFAAMARSMSLFLSRGDQSGTHKAEQRLWAAAGVDLRGEPALNAWYRESGSGQGATLNIAVNLGAYVLTDEATFATFQNRGDLVVLFDRDDEMMQNLYSIILVNPERFPEINSAGAKLFADWLTSAEGRAAISSFKVNGQQPFRPGHEKNPAA